MRELLVCALRRIPGISTREASDGREALQHMEEACPDIILTDINMPVMDGLTLLKHMCARERD
jgi:two-component system chemotaxis response regulator CheY